MSFKYRLYLVAAAIVFVLLLFVYLDAKASTMRPRYTLIDQYISFLFSNHDTLPFQIIREMCWNESGGFCDEGLAGAEEIYLLIDWHTQTYGAIFETEDGTCFWWMYQEAWGSDGNPHIAEHYWIDCP